LCLVIYPLRYFIEAI